MLSCLKVSWPVRYLTFEPTHGRKPIFSFSPPHIIPSVLWEMEVFCAVEWKPKVFWEEYGMGYRPPASLTVFGEKRSQPRQARHLRLTWFCLTAQWKGPLYTLPVHSLRKCWSSCPLLHFLEKTLWCFVVTWISTTGVSHTVAFLLENRSGRIFPCGFFFFPHQKRKNFFP